MGKQNKRLHGLDHLRSAAIILVLLFHYKVYYGVPEWINSFSSFGWSGVDLFFVLSGYLITEKLFSEHEKTGRINFKGFYWNRFFRIIPAYLTIVLFYYYFPQLREGRGLQPLWKFLTFTQNISIDMYLNTFSHAWSLCAEEHFYLLLPMVLYIIFSKKLTNKTFYFLAIVLVMGLIIRYSVWEIFIQPALGRQRLILAIKYIYYPTYMRMDGLLAGVAVATIFRYCPLLKEKMVKHGNFLFLISVFLLFIAYFQFGGSVLSMKFTSLGTSLFGFPLISFAYGLMVIAALSPDSALYKFQFRPSRMLATLSYSIYLIHKITNHLMNTKLADNFTMRTDQIFLMSLFAAVLGGFALYIIVEKPFLILRDRYKFN
ncbi:MAG: acyltransferase [Deltaproteobacteria bacterium]|nr:acyltransferase [Candidatus Desulfobacula maris]